MKILHINTSQNGGASLCSIRINNALVQRGVDCKMLFAYGNSMPEGVDGEIAGLDVMASLRNHGWFTKFFYDLLMLLPCFYERRQLIHMIANTNSRTEFLHKPLTDFTNISHHPLVEWADIIHLHWVPDFVDYLTFFKRVKKPIVWTLHDKYPAVGIQHYCSEFVPIPEDLKELDQLYRTIKREGILHSKDLNIVAISEQVLRICNDSYVLNGFPCSLIHNGVETKVFKPDKGNIKLLLSKYQCEYIIKPETKVFMFSAFDILDENKGLHRVIDALAKVDAKDIALFVVGNNKSGKKPIAPFPVFYLGFIECQEEIAKLYSFADYFILASYEETFSQTPLEAMSCGTPVISTPCSGASDLIRSFNGVISDGFDSTDLAEAIEKAMVIKYDSNAIRQYIIDNYDYSIIAEEYIALYEKILNK